MTDDTRTLQWLIQAEPDRIAALLEAIDTDDPALEEVRTAIEIGDDLAACRSLLDFCRQSPVAFFAGREPISVPFPTVDEADDIMDDTLTLYRVRGRIPRRADGGWQWEYYGPEGDIEWGLGLNRHYHLAALFNAWRKTGHRAYIRRIDEQLRDWILSCPYPGEKTSSTVCWRGLEVHFRMKVWARLFHHLAGDDDLSPSTRILMLSSIPEHTHYLEHFHAATGNWITMEMTGLATAAVAWPHFRQTPQWLEYAEEQMLPQPELQLYPDGLQKELTSHYHYVTLGNMEQFADVLEASGSKVPHEYTDALERMWNYLAMSIRQNGFGVLNNDSDYDDNRRRVLDAAARYNRPDWLYLASGGKRGTPPSGSPSAVFPWGGQLVMRSGPASGDQWAFFDFGPLGIAHRHYDKLHLSVRALGRDLLVDSGRYTYVAGQWREYFIGTRSHNTILIDGCGEQDSATREVDEPAHSGDYLLTDAFDFARGTYNEGYHNLQGNAAHTRAMVYLRGSGWIVIDRIRTDRPRIIDVLWHYHPHCTVAIDGGDVASIDQRKGNLRISPMVVIDELARPALIAGSAARESISGGRADDGSPDLGALVTGSPNDQPATPEDANPASHHHGPQWSISLLRGQIDPHPQGWYSRCYGVKEPATCAIFRAAIAGDVTFGWLLSTGRNMPPRPLQADLTLREADTLALAAVEWPGHPRRTVRIPLIAGQAELLD